MKKLLFISFILLQSTLRGQTAVATNFGFRHIQIVYEGDSVDILIKSKKGEELKRKPVFLFCQGSLPIPLIIHYDDKGRENIYNPFVFNTDSLSNDYHLAIVNKPNVPLVAKETELNPDMTYSDGAGRIPPEYIQRNLLDYYVNRNIKVIKYLQAQNWVNNKRLIVAGHSEGSTIAAKLALLSPQVTHLIYSGGNPFGRLSTMVQRERAIESASSGSAEVMFELWEKIVKDSTNIKSTDGDPYKTTYQFSIPPMQYLQQLKIPVLVCYGTKDAGSPFNDYFRLIVIQQRKKNIMFKAYIGSEHNYFPVLQDGKTDYETFNWDKVANDWRNWLIQN